MRGIERTVTAFAGLFGATGIIASALHAHRDADPALLSAALILLVHAPMLIAVLAALRVGLLARFGGIITLVAIIIGVILFSGSIGFRIATGTPLFPMAAPTGGILLIAGWAILAVTGIFLRKAD